MSVSGISLIVKVAIEVSFDWFHHESHMDIDWMISMAKPERTDSGAERVSNSACDTCSVAPKLGS